VLLIGWDAADWKVIKPLLERGRMPHLQRLIEQGVMGNLATQRPMLSPMLWTTIATGKRPDKHGILGFTEPEPSGEGVRTVQSTSRTCKALWNILSQQGLKTHVLGWFASHPAEPINGVCVSERFGKATAEYGELWPLPPEAVHPAGLSETLAALRVHPGELQLSDLLPFVPQAARIDQAKDRRLMMLAQVLAECASIHAAATWVLESQPWDFVGVYYNAIDHLCHRFMYYHPPRMSHIPEEDFSLYSNVIWAAYCFHDLLLGRLLALAGEDATVLLVSDHGYHSDHMRPTATPAMAAGPVQWHREHGVCVLKGEHVRKDELLFGATIQDVTPTILTLFGLPAGADMDGKPWLHALEHPVGIETIPSWDAVPGPCGMHPPERQSDPFQEREALAQLVALGYIALPPEDGRQAAVQAASDRDFNLAQSLLSTGRVDRALPLLERLHADRPDHLLAALYLANAYFETHRRAECRRVVEYVAAGNCSHAAIEDPQVKLVPQMDYLLGMLELSEGRTAKALEHLQRAEAEGGRLRGFHMQIGQAYARLQRWSDARRAFAAALELDPDDAKAHQGLAVVLLEQGQNEAAFDHALQSVGLFHHQPRSHYALGLACRRLGMTERARQAFEVSLAMAPNQADVHRELADLHQAVIGDTVRAEAHRRRAEELEPAATGGRAT
jgi:tetratricopeptide (TPR) repeat protein